MFGWRYAHFFTIPRHDVLMVVGYLNATVSEDNTGRERVMGTQGFNNNGEKLSDLCVENNLGERYSSTEPFTKPL